MKRFTRLIITIVMLIVLMVGLTPAGASDPYYVKATIGSGTCSTSGFSVASSLTWHLPSEVIVYRTFWLNSTLVFEETFVLNPDPYASFSTTITPGGPTVSAGFPATLPYTYTIVTKWYMKSVHISSNIRQVNCSAAGVEATVYNSHSFPY